jgi:uncharacterized protein (UPF0276 family)
VSVCAFRTTVTFSTSGRSSIFEIISENFMGEGGKPLYHLGRVLETYRVVQHGVSS